MLRNLGRKLTQIFGNQKRLLLAKNKGTMSPLSMIFYVGHILSSWKRNQMFSMLTRIMRHDVKPSLVYISKHCTLIEVANTQLENFSNISSLVILSPSLLFIILSSTMVYQNTATGLLLSADELYFMQQLIFLNIYRLIQHLM